MNIPREKSPRARDKRYKAVRKFIEKWISEHPSMRVYNYSLREYIYLKRTLAIRENPYWASKKYKSTMMILEHFDEIMKYARKTGYATPKSDTGNSRFAKFVILEKDVRGLGTAKLTVGIKRIDNMKIQYCITAIE